ncbi:MAG TPA: hypothetical protein VIM96_10940 [Pseudomonadales bacterium]
MIAFIQRQLDARQPLNTLFERRPERPPRAFQALQRQLHACQIDVTESVIHEASQLAGQHPELTVGQFAHRLLSRQH